MVQVPNWAVYLAGAALLVPILFFSAKYFTRYFLHIVVFAIPSSIFLGLTYIPGVTIGYFYQTGQNMWVVEKMEQPQLSYFALGYVTALVFEAAIIYGFIKSGGPLELSE